jgi:spoIIIJ-associated protein
MLEKIGNTIEEAIQEGLAELNLKSEEVEIEVLDEGSKGLFGLGARMARVRLTVKGSGGESEPVEFPHSDEEVQVADEAELELLEEAIAEGISPANDLIDDLTFHVVRETVTELLERMNFSADIKLRYGETDEMHPRPPVHVDIFGKDLSMLIGKRAETLNALQYIASLIASKELGRSITLILDVEGYRERRYNQVRQIAQRMADQAIKTGRRQVLEPMPPNERRIIHMTLRENPDVKTESTGEEPFRKVTILPIK